jgi:hypothetical protein
VASGSAAFFTNPFEASCLAINVCILKVSPGCGSNYDMSTSNLAITTSTGAITAAQNIDAGYEETVCIECSNPGGSSITYNTWKVT